MLRRTPFAAAVLFWACLFLPSARAADGGRVDFARDVLPVLSDNCFHCHGPDEKARKAKLRLDTKDGAYRVADGVAVVAPGNSGGSELVRRILSDDPDEAMPPPGGVRKLSADQKQTLRRWVDQGAQWGAHWAFVPPPARVPVPALPPAPPAGWAANPVDAFVLDRLAREGLAPRPEADHERLIRRVSFDLTGLPPTPAEVDAFVADTSPKAYERVVDRLLASPRYGERMAADWLDVARFADTHGYQMDRFRPVHPYRDWVIGAFNANVPFDRFATMQLAGDLMPPAATLAATKNQVLATAFNRLHMQNEEGGIVAEEFRVAYVADRVNTFGTAFLGMTFECARCHDHKYDPVSQRDVYQLFAFFQNIDESGQTSYFTDATPVPTMLLSTDAQDAKLKELGEGVRKAGDAYDSVKRQAAAGRGGAGGAFEDWSKARPERVPDALPGLVARYDFDAIEKNAVVNAVDPKAPGKATENPTLVDRHRGKAVGLGGENGFTFPGVGRFTRADPFTLALWVKADELAPRAVLLHKSKAPADAGSRGYELLLEDGRIAFGLHHMWPGNALKVVSKRAVPAGAWAHVAVTYDGSSAAAGVRLYLDGEPAEVEVVRDGLWKDITYGRGGEPDLTLGYRFRDNGFKGGAVDDLEVYNRDLSAPEVAHVAGKGTLEAAWRFRDVGSVSGGGASGEEGVAARSTLATYYAAAASPDVARARAALRAARAAQSDFVNPIPEMMVMRELPVPKPAYVLVRGNYDAPGEPVSADTPHALPPFPAGQPRNRLGLARWLFDPDNPLAARVAVNRLWQQMFGRGIVESADNFGTTGSVPTHPELLDYLARTFAGDLAWDQKRLLKLLATSATYRQSSKASSDLLARDPSNALLARGPARRLTAEMLRDQALADAGLLVERLGGPSVKPYQPAGLWDIAMGKPSYDQSHGDDLYRRSLYTFVKRTVAPPSLLTFDATDRSGCTVKRQSTSTPLQALALLNDVQMTEAARKVAERAIRAGGQDDAARAAYAFRLVTGRRPTDRELPVLTRLLAEQRELFAADPPAAAKLLTVGESKPEPALDPVEVASACVLAQALFGHDEAVMRR
ncbi:MAG: Planctomycete cytochrome [Phycisphaerales bacterium]|nr:Planctomycete cytochrome [Phycisphaerales bacterium]